MLRTIEWSVLALGAVILLVTLYLEHASGYFGRIVIPKHDIELPPAPAGQEIKFGIPVRVSDIRGTRILGVTLAACGVNCNVRPEREPPYEVGWGRGEIPCSVLLGDPGKYSGALAVFYEDDGVREITVTVHGVATSPEP